MDHMINLRWKPIDKFDPNFDKPGWYLLLSAEGEIEIYWVESSKDFAKDTVFFAPNKITKDVVEKYNGFYLYEVGPFKTPLEAYIHFNTPRTP